MQADISDIKEIEVACGLSPWTIGAYEAELRNPDSIILKAESIDGMISGFITGRAPTSGEAEIHNIGTSSRFRRQGVGSLLFERFRILCRERHVAAIWLEVRASNDAAMAFYRSHGLERRGTRPNFYSNPAEDAELMFLALN